MIELNLIVRKSGVIMMVSICGSWLVMVNMLRFLLVFLLMLGRIIVMSVMLIE